MHHDDPTIVSATDDGLTRVDGDGFRADEEPENRLDVTRVGRRRPLAVGWAARHLGEAVMQNVAVQREVRPRG